MFSSAHRNILTCLMFCPLYICLLQRAIQCLTPHSDANVQTNCDVLQGKKEIIMYYVFLLNTFL